MATQTITPTTVPTPGPDEWQEIELQLVDIVNADRTSRGLSSLEWDQLAADVAQQHADDMIENDYRSLWDLDGFGPHLRYAQAGGTEMVFEQINWYQDLNARYKRGISREGWERLLQGAHSDLVKKYGVKAEPLDPTHTHVGVGIAYDAMTGEMVIVQEFLNRYIVLEGPLPEDWQRGEHYEIEGQMTAEMLDASARLYYEPEPTQMTVAEINADPGCESGMVLSPDGYASLDSVAWLQDEIEINVRPGDELRRGLYHVRVFVELADSPGEYAFAVDLVRPIRGGCWSWNPAPTHTPTPTPTRTPTITRTPTVFVTPTPTVTIDPSLILTPSPTRTLRPLPTPSPTLAQRDWSVYQQQIVDTINADRTAAGLEPLEWDQRAANVAQQHALSIIRQDYLSCWDPGGYDSCIRYGLAGGTEEVYENVYARGWIAGVKDNVPISYWDSVVDSVFEDMIVEASYRATILSPEHTHVGIGIAYDPLTGRFAINQELLNRYVIFDDPPQSVEAGLDYVLTGHTTAEISEASVTVLYEPQPTPLTVEEIEAMDSCGSRAIFYDRGTASIEENTLELRFSLPAGAPIGLYHVTATVTLADSPGIQIPAVHLVLPLAD